MTSRIKRALIALLGIPKQFTTADGYAVNVGEIYYTVYYKPTAIGHRAHVEECKFENNVYLGSDWVHLRFKLRENAQIYADINNKKKFALLEIEHACFHCGIKDDSKKRLIQILKSGIYEI